MLLLLMLGLLARLQALLRQTQRAQHLWRQALPLACRHRQLLSAVRYELEKLRCSACGAVFTAPAPDDADKYSPRAKAVIALGRYSLGLPFYRLEQYQALVGVPVADAINMRAGEIPTDTSGRPMLKVPVNGL